MGETTAARSGTAWTAGSWAGAALARGVAGGLVRARDALDRRPEGLSLAPPGRPAAAPRALPAPSRDVVVIHETDGRKYLEALTHLHGAGELRSLAFYEASVAWKVLHGCAREGKSLPAALAQSGRNLGFRCRAPFLRDAQVVLAVAPWDWHFPLYARMLRANRLIYNTSWPWWDGARVPRRYGPLTATSRRGWERVLRGGGVRVTAVTEAALDGVAALAGRDAARVVPHVVSPVFLAARARHATPFRLLFVGELSDKKGAGDLGALLDRLAGVPVALEVVGDGPRRDAVAALAASGRCTWHGRVDDRARLAAIAGGCQALVSLSRRTPRWEELFGMNVAEAMAAGLPCLVPDHVGPRSLVGTGAGAGGAVLPEGDLDAYAAAARRLATEPGWWAACSAAAARRGAAFSLERVAADWRGVLDLAQAPPA